MTNNGYIYIMRNENACKGSYKIGKTISIINTRRTYERNGNIKLIYYSIIDSMDYIETIILNILGPYRTKKNNSSHLLEEVNMDINILKYIIGWCIQRTVTYGIEFNIKRCCSVNTMNNHRQNIVNNRNILYPFWNEICKNLIYTFNIEYPIPMEIDDRSLMIYLNINDFDNIIMRTQNKKLLYN